MLRLHVNGLVLNDGRGSKVANSYSASAEQIVEEWEKEGSAISNLKVLLNRR